MRILYLPSSPKYRAFVERSLEFVGQVYKDELLADLEFVAFSSSDPDDVAEVLFNRGLTGILYSHYDIELRRAVVVVCRDECIAIDTFSEAVEEITHHVLWDTRYKERVIRALVKDVPQLNKVVAKRLRKVDAHNLKVFFNELDTEYIVSNYFEKRNVKPELMPWHFEVLGETIQNFVPLAEILVGGVLADVVQIMYIETVMKRNPLPNFREAVHAIFTEVIKRFPAEVYKSNPSRYEVLYMKQNIQKLPL
jgi:hypothetical protein